MNPAGHAWGAGGLGSPRRNRVIRSFSATAFRDVFNRRFSLTDRLGFLVTDCRGDLSDIHSLLTDWAGAGGLGLLSSPWRPAGAGRRTPVMAAERAGTRRAPHLVGAAPLQTTLDDLHRNLLLGDGVGCVYSELAASWLWVLVVGRLALWIGKIRGRCETADTLLPPRGTLRPADGMHSAQCATVTREREGRCRSRAWARRTCSWQAPPRRRLRWR
jgi:hypothetical protein